MCQSTLPIKQSSSAAAFEEEHSSTYYPSGMLDRDQRTAFTIKRIRMVPSNVVTIPLREFMHKNNIISSIQPEGVLPTTTNTNTIHHRNNSEWCKFECHQIKDNKKSSVMCPAAKYSRLSGIYRSRTKFCINLQVFLWIWILAVCPTCSVPISKPITDCVNTARNQLTLNGVQTGHSINNLSGSIHVFREVSRLSPQTWGHHVQDIDKSKIKTLFTDKKASKEELQNGLKFISDHLHTASKAFNYILNMHEKNWTAIEDAFSVTKYSNEDIIHFFNGTIENIRLNIFHISDTSTNLNLNIPLPDVYEIGVQWDEKDLLLFEFKRVEEYIQVLQYMLEFYEHASKSSHVIQNICKLKNL